VFAEAARTLKLWLLVRLTNGESLKFIGLSNYTPKPIDCKAKTADYNYAPRYQVAGLVVDPTEHAMAFTGDRRVKALATWKDFQPVLQNAATGYSVDRDPSSQHYGCVTLCRAETGGRRKYLHGDYDLYDAIDANNVRTNLAIVDNLREQRHMRGPEFNRVQQFVNSRIGIPMIQHSDQSKFTHHSNEPVDVFGPQGQECTLLNEFTIRAWYRNQFEGRRTLVEKLSPHQQN